MSEKETKSIPVDFMIDFKVALILLAMTLCSQTVDNIAVYSSATQLAINSWFGQKIQPSSGVCS